MRVPAYDLVVYSVDIQYANMFVVTTKECYFYA